MKVSVNDIELFTLTPTQKKVIQNDISADIFDEDMKRRLNWSIIHPYEREFKNLKNEWEPKLKVLGVTEIPLDDTAFAELVFSRTEYKDMSTREAEKVKV